MIGTINQYLDDAKMSLELARVALGEVAQDENIHPVYVSDLAATINSTLASLATRPLFCPSVPPPIASITGGDAGELRRARLLRADMRIWLLLSPALSNERKVKALAALYAKSEAAWFLARLTRGAISPDVLAEQLLNDRPPLRRLPPVAYEDLP
jgi:hypothetical protein